MGHEFSKKLATYPLSLLSLILLGLTACNNGGGGASPSTPIAYSSTFTTQENTPGTGFFNVVFASSATPTYTIVQNGSRGTAVVSDQATGEFTYTPNPDVTGSDAFTYKFSDGSTDSNIAVVSVSIIQATPVATNDSVTTNEDTPATIDILANDLGNGHPLDPATVTLVALPAHGGATANGDGTVTYTPNLNSNGTDNFTYSVENTLGRTSNVAQVALTISAVNDTPVAADDDFSVLEDSTTTLAVLANNGHGADSDVDGDALAITAVGIPNQGGNISVNSSHTGLLYTPAPNFFGIETVSYTISDGNGGSDSATVTVSVLSVNDPPVAANDDITVAEDSTTTMAVQADNGHGLDSDVDGGTLTIIGVSLTSQGGSLSLNGSHTGLIYTPVANFSGTETFNYTLGDGQGGTDIAAVTVTVTPVNDAPVTQDDDFAVAEDSTTTLAVLADNGHGPDSDIEGDTLAITVVGSTSQGGSVAIDGTQTGIVYSPSPNFSGMETFSYTISDGNGGATDGSVTVTVTPINDAPVAQDDSFTVALNSSSNTLMVLADHGNGADTDADNDPLTITAVGTPDHGGNVSINGSQDALIYSPPVGYIGLETFTYSISDGNGGTDTAMVSVISIFTDNFSGGTGNWSFVNDSGIASSWSIISGALRQQNGVESVNSFDQSYHKGTYAYYTSGTSLTNYRFSVDALFLGTVNADDIGVMFRYQNNDNYYRLSVNSRYGFTRLEKKVSGSFTPLAVNSRGYDSGQILNLVIEVNGNLILVWMNNDPIFSVQDSSLSSGSVALYTQDKSSFDNVQVEGTSTTPTIVLGSPIADTVITANSVSATAMAANVPAGGGVEFALDGSPTTLDPTPPYSVTFSGVSQGDHIIESVIRDSSNVELSRDTNSDVGVLGDFYIAFGDSIINGIGDNYAADNQTKRILSFQGLASNLTDLLDTSTVKPNIVYNEGIGGDESVDTAFTRVNSILARHPDANKALILLGTNDAFSSIPSGLGCSGAACNGTFKGNMQSLINTLTAAGLTVSVARILPAFGSGSIPFTNPLTASFNTNYIQPYNSVITSQLTGCQVGPDLFAYFLSPTVNRFSLYTDTVHPNGLGYLLMAYLWHNSLNPGSPAALPFVLDSLTPSTSSPYLKQNLLETGDTYYVDRAYTLTAIPSALTEGRWIMTANNDANNTSSSYVTFSVDRPVTVYIAYDAGASTRPNWMSSFSSTGLTLGTTDPFSSTLNLYSRSYGAGQITLGGNMAAGASGSDSNYLAIVIAN
jgi:lysophospholipase L1-like esterase